MLNVCALLICCRRGRTKNDQKANFRMGQEKVGHAISGIPTFSLQVCE